MASTVCILNHHAFNLAPTISRSSLSQRHRPNIKASKFVCRAQNKPLSNGNQVQGGVSRRSVLDGLIVGSALGASADAACGDDGSRLEPSGNKEIITNICILVIFSFCRGFIPQTKYKLFLSNYFHWLETRNSQEYIYVIYR